MKLDTYVSLDMARYAQEYIDYCRDLMSRADRYWIEEKIDMTNYVDDGFGTVDFAALVGDTLYIVDLKYGKGVQVFADTPQAKYYAVCLMDTYQLNPKFFSSTIFQPRIGHIDVAQYTFEDLMAAAKRFKKAAKRVDKMDRIIKGLKSGTPIFNPGAHCGFCKARLRCRALRHYLVHQGPLSTEGFTKIKEEGVQARRDDWVKQSVHLLTKEELADYFIWSDLAIRTGQAIKTEATRCASHGDDLDGLKLVAGRRGYFWEDNVAAERMLKEAGLTDDEIYPKLLISPAQASKLLGKKMHTHPLVTSTPGKATLVTKSDRRKPLEPDSIADATKGFVCS